MLRDTSRDHVALKRRPLVRFWVCEQNLSHAPPDVTLPDAVRAGAEPFFVVGAVGGGQPAQNARNPMKYMLLVPRLLGQPGWGLGVSTRQQRKGNQCRVIR